MAQTFFSFLLIMLQQCIDLEGYHGDDSEHSDQSSDSSITVPAAVVTSSESSESGEEPCGCPEERNMTSDCFKRPRTVENNSQEVLSLLSGLQAFRVCEASEHPRASYEKCVSKVSKLLRDNPTVPLKSLSSTWSQKECDAGVF